VRARPFEDIEDKVKEAGLGRANERKVGPLRLS